MNSPRVAFITAIYGNYEATCKPFVKQSVDADFICFTNCQNIQENGWILDRTPYHELSPSPLDTENQHNSLKNNQHTFNIAKYYKQAFLNIERLQNYDVVIWLDGTVEIVNPHTAEWILHNIKDKKIITWEHEKRYGSLLSEVNSSIVDRYISTFWFGQAQPMQDVKAQYRSYLEDGYDEGYWETIDASRENLGVWLTCFIAFDIHSEEVRKFLDLWYLQTLTYTTQDQIGFPYVVQKTGLIPYTLPDAEIKGAAPHNKTDFYIKHSHGK